MKKTNKGTIFWILLLVVIFLEIGAEFFVKKYTLEPKKLFIIISMILYAIIPVFLIGLFKRDKTLTAANTLWQISNLVLVAVIGVMFFGDKLSRTQWIGFALAIVAAVLLVM
mgnify:CR=1 FL=1